MEQKHGRSYGLIKKIIAAGKMDKDTLLEKIDVIFAAGGLTAEDYAEIAAEIDAKKEVI